MVGDRRLRPARRARSGAGFRPTPWFFTITGDLTNRATSDELDSTAAALRSFRVPFAAVAGNHDWIDGGRGYLRRFGPPSYSFDLGGVHFVTLNDNPRGDPDLDFLRRDLAGVAAAGDVLYVGTYDGTLRAFATDGTADPIRAPPLHGAGSARDAITGALVGASLSALGLAGVAAIARRRRRVSAR